MDWDKIVVDYSEHLGSQPDTGPMVRDVTALPYPREMIRSAIKHFMISERDPQLLGLYNVLSDAIAKRAKGGRNGLGC